MKAKISFRNILRVIESFFVKQFSPKHIKEQVIFRTLLANKCVIAGECEFCGCSMKGVFDKRYIFAACDKKYHNLDYCYDELKTKKEWKEFKKLTSLDIDNLKLLTKEIKYGADNKTNKIK